MVKIGFICEGKTEKNVIESDKFQDWLKINGFECSLPVIDAKGNGNLLPHKIEALRRELLDRNVQKIIILTDLDIDSCISLTRQRITERDNQIIIVAVKQIEAWFLSDTPTLQSLFNDSSFIFEHPEQEINPFLTLQQLLVSKTNRGVGSKGILVSRMLKYGFSVENAAQHPNCSSAHYFLTKLRTLASAN
ncbi:hypothetical protein [Spirosoma sp. KNUC1025]|uniref:hypothetical protein n=1 Tax=Spirosoma sp. KNUC1025 TaxID=2894082 RepID=UPI003865AAD3|nr:DUF4276 family protein [Spirosoma sp. KNUC1025]